MNLGNLTLAVVDKITPLQTIFDELFKFVHNFQQSNLMQCLMRLLVQLAIEKAVTANFIPETVKYTH